MKTMILMMICAFAACTVESAPAPTVQTAEQSLICDPNCDPGNFQYLVDQVIGEASFLGQQISAIECYHYFGGDFPDPDGGWTYHPAHDECAGTWQDPWGSRYRVWCSSIAPCTHDGCGWPGQLPCP